MTRLFKLGVWTALWIPLTVSAGATLEDIEGLESQTDAVAAGTDPVEVTPVITAISPIKSTNRRAVSNKPIQLTNSEPVFQFYASDKAAELSYERNKPVFGLNNNRTVVSFLMNEERDNAMTAGILYDIDMSVMRGLKLSFGPKVIAGLLSIENADIFGFAANIEALYVLPMKKFPLRLSSGFSYAPDILTFGQSDRIIDWNFRAGFPLTKNIDGFVGARYMQFDTRPGERKLDQQVHIGIRWSGKS